MQNRTNLEEKPVVYKNTFETTHYFPHRFTYPGDYSFILPGIKYIVIAGGLYKSLNEPIPPQLRERILSDEKYIHLLGESTSYFPCGSDSYFMFYDKKNRKMTLYNATSSLPVTNFEQGKEPYSAFLLTPDGKELLTIGSFEIKIWDVLTGTLKKDQAIPLRDSSNKYENGKNKLLPLANKLLPIGDGKFFISYSNPFNGKIKDQNPTRPQILLWDVATKKLLKTLYAPSRIIDIDVGPDNNHFISIHEDQSLYVWDITKPFPSPVSIHQLDPKEIPERVVVKPDGTACVINKNNSFTSINLRLADKPLKAELEPHLVADLHPIIVDYVNGNINSNYDPSLFSTPKTVTGNCKPPPKGIQTRVWTID